jgi:hypothetical protein
MIQVLQTHEQLVELHGAIKEFYQKMPYTKKALDAGVWADKWLGLIQAGTGTVIAALKDDKIIGGIGLRLSGTSRRGIVVLVYLYTRQQRNTFERLAPTGSR